VVNYDQNAPFVPTVPEQKIRLPVHHREMVLGTWNCGWSC